MLPQCMATESFCKFESVFQEAGELGEDVAMEEPELGSKVSCTASVLFCLIACFFSPKARQAQAWDHEL